MNSSTFAEIVTKHLVTYYRAQSLLCSALEGGSNYWYTIADYRFPEGVCCADFNEGGRFAEPDTFWHPAQLIPFHSGCAVIFATQDEDAIDGKMYFPLDRAAMVKGLELLSEFQPQRHWRAFVEENDDAETGDVWLQLCLFGKVVFS